VLLMANPVELWKSEKHGFDVWPDVERHARAGTPMDQIDAADLERMKWHGFFYRKRDNPGRYMNRIRLTANELTAPQAKELARIAYEYGHGIIDITTRANVQVQGLDVEHLPRVAERLGKVGLTSMQTGHDNVRNVFGHPFSGLMPDELIDTRQLCRDVDALFLGSRAYSDLPRKLNVCLSGVQEHAAHYWTQDLSFLATRDEDGDVAFQVLLAGTQGQNPHLAWHLPVLVRPEQVVPFTRAIFDLFREKGSREKRNAARLRFLVEEIGVGGVLDWLTGQLPFRLLPCHQAPVPAATTENFVGWFRQSDSRRWTMGLSVPLGRMTWRQLEGTALLSQRFGDGQMRTTVEQGLAVINIPTGFREAAATEAASFGLSLLADAYELNTMACTGSQFCNIAVTETKGHMFQLIDKLRKRALKLHGIRIHMSGCPSSCAQHFTADIGLKGVRVRRLIGTREGFDVYLGGGLAGQVHMGLPYRLGVDVDQLPQLVEHVVTEFYARHRTGETFSAYWRSRLQALQAEKVEDGDYQVPVWLCETCQYRHSGEDPPVFCPSCAGLRRHFARLEGDDGLPASVSEPSESPADGPRHTTGSPGTGENGTIRADGYRFAARLDEIPEKHGLTVEIAGTEYALFRHEGGVTCLDSACPHEGAALADGEFKNGVVCCPWHNWTFNVCTGCSLDPPGHAVTTYPTTIEDGQVYVLIESRATATDAPPDVGSPAPSPSLAMAGAGSPGTAATQRIASESIAPDRSGTRDEGVAARAGRRTPPRPAEAELTILDIIEEARDVKTFRLCNARGAIPFDLPGKFARVCVLQDGEEHWSSFTISSSPAQPGQIELTIKLNPCGRVTPHLFGRLRPGDSLRLKGAQGGFCFDPQRHGEPLVLISAGSGITPMMSMARFIRDTGLERRVTFLYGARSAADIIFHHECRQLAQTAPWFRYYVTLSQPNDDWQGPVGRLDIESVLAEAPDLTGARCFLCGPNQFMEQLQQGLREHGVPGEKMHTESFQAGAPAVYAGPLGSVR
jgi:ferredoxin-nitrite reductase